jgi:hypothetical protein
MFGKNSCGGPSGDCKQAVWVMTRVQVWISQPHNRDRVLTWAVRPKAVAGNYGSRDELLLHGMGTRGVCRAQ